jgi:CDP-diacylglycerol--inositol 3-phosphatidyltransferase
MYTSSFPISLVSSFLLISTVTDSCSGYTRVILVGISLHYMGSHPNACTLLYGISALLDAVDGQAARALGQTSRFGAVLDMVTDR